MKTKKLNFEPMYGGKHSKAFWNKIAAIKNKAKHDHCYSLGVILQNVEGDILRLMDV
jgi:hypothetical protein